MRALAVTPHYAALIIAGYKTIEVRSKPIKKIKERVAVYSTLHKPTALEMSILQETMGDLVRAGPYTPEERNDVIKLINSAPRGCILGTVEIVDSKLVGSDLYFDTYTPEHLAPDYYKEDKTYFWELKRPVKFETPIPIKWPSTGSWAQVELPEGY